MGSTSFRVAGVLQCRLRYWSLKKYLNWLWPRYLPDLCQAFLAAGREIQSMFHVAERWWLPFESLGPGAFTDSILDLVIVIVCLPAVRAKLKGCLHPALALAARMGQRCSLVPLRLRQHVLHIRICVRSFLFSFAMLLNNSCLSTKILFGSGAIPADKPVAGNPCTTAVLVHAENQHSWQASNAWGREKEEVFERMLDQQLKNISQVGNLSQIGAKITTIWNHHLEYHVAMILLPYFFQLPWAPHRVSANISRCATERRLRRGLGTEENIWQINLPPVLQETRV